MPNVLSLVQPDEMTDEEESAFDAAVADPTLIKTAAEARGVLHLLDGDIEEIRQQLDGARIEAGICPLPEHRQDWLRRAGHALAGKLRQRGTVGVRLAELCPPPPPVHAPDPLIDKVVAKVTQNVKNRSEKVRLAELRLTQEEAIRVRKAEEAEAKLRNIARATEQTSQQAELFVRAARKIYSADECQKIWDRAKADYPDNPAWN